MNKKFFISLFCICAFTTLNAQVRATFRADASFTNTSILRTMEQNLSEVLSEANSAYDARRELSTIGLPMTEKGKEAIQMLWSNAKFYCDDPNVVKHIFNFNGNQSYMVRGIPLLLTPRDDSGASDQYVESVVEFDASGRISDFYLSSKMETGMSLEGGGDPVDIERKTIILKYCDRFRTAYNIKDLNFIKQVFSEDAIIITGSVVTTRTYDGKPISSVKYKKQDKEQYIKNLSRVFNANKSIEVNFYEIGTDGEGGASSGITRSRENPNIYGVRLRQTWKASNGYHDEGYVFLLWDFADEDHPVIHVRTWQPEYVGDKRISDTDLFSLEDFVDTF